MHTIILFGLKGSGKTYFGKRLANKLQAAFIDIDESLEKQYQLQFQQSLSVREIFLKEGEPFFRDLESRFLLALQPKIPTVIALGGGSLINPNHAPYLATLGSLVYLKADPLVLRKRIFEGPIPSFFDPNDLEGSFQKMIEARLALYESIDALCIDLKDKKDEIVLEELASVFYRSGA